MKYPLLNPIQRLPRQALMPLTLVAIAFLISSAFPTTSYYLLVSNHEAAHSAIPSIPTPAQHVKPVDLKDALQDVRNRHQSKPKTNWLDNFPGFKRFLQQGLKFINDFVTKMFEALQKSMPEWKPIPGLSKTASQTLSLIVSGLLALVALTGFAFILRYILINMERKPKLRSIRPLNKTFDNTLLITSEHHYQEAKKQSENGLYDKSIQELYYASLCLLDEQQIIPFDETRTNAECRKILASNDKTADGSHRFGNSAQLFEQTRYGHYPAQYNDFLTMREHYQQLSDTLTTLESDKPPSSPLHKRGRKR